MASDQKRKRTPGATTPKREKLVLEFNVTGLDDDEIAALELEVAVQGEASDGQGGKRYNGKTGHPDAPILDVRRSKHGDKAVLIIEFDITRLSKKETGYLGAEAEIQASDSDDHPDVEVTSKIVSFTGR